MPTPDDECGTTHHKALLLLLLTSGTSQYENNQHTDSVTDSVVAGALLSSVPAGCSSPMGRIDSPIIAQVSGLTTPLTLQKIGLLQNLLSG